MVDTRYTQVVHTATRVRDISHIEEGKIYLFTDGAGGKVRSDGLQPGGYGAVMLYGEHRKLIYGGEVDCTSNAMELTAILEGLKAIKSVPLGGITIITDSQYCIGACSVWHRGWERNGWRNSAGQPVANRDIIEAILVEKARLGNKVTFQWTPGHSAGGHLNEVADRLAARGKDRARSVGGNGLSRVEQSSLDPQQSVTLFNEVYAEVTAPDYRTGRDLTRQNAQAERQRVRQEEIARRTLANMEREEQKRKQDQIARAEKKERKRLAKLKKDEAARLAAIAEQERSDEEERQARIIRNFDL